MDCKAYFNARCGKKDRKTVGVHTVVFYQLSNSPER